MACLCRCGRTIDCGETACGLCGAEAVASLALAGCELTQNPKPATMIYPKGMKEEDYELVAD